MLTYPGSEVLAEQGADEGEGHGFDRLDRGAMIDRWHRSVADGADILAWYAARLEALGWTRRSRSNEHSVFTRGFEYISLVLSPPETRSLWAPSWDDNEPGTVYRLNINVPVQSPDIDA